MIFVNFHLIESIDAIIRGDAQWQGGLQPSNSQLFDLKIKLKIFLVCLQETGQKILSFFRGGGGGNLMDC